MQNNLTKAFRELRKVGYFAKQNFTCCQTCAWAEVPDGVEKVVFYHNQDNETKKQGEPFHLAWSGDGREIQRILKKNGVKTKWSGSEDKRILVTQW